MAKQSKYTTDTIISRTDKLTGIDSVDGKTKNFEVGDISDFVKTSLESTQIVISGSSFILQKHPNNTVNLTTLEQYDVILGFEPSGSYIMAQYLGGDSTDFFNSSVYNIFNGL